jgi:proteic killer suppression protein
MIESFKDAATKELYETGKSRKLPAQIRRVAQRKLSQLRVSVELNDLAVPPGNRLEALHGDREGQHSIRINDQIPRVFRMERGQGIQRRNRGLPLGVRNG